MEREVDQFRSSTGRWLYGSAVGLLTLVLCLIGVGLVLIGVRWLRNRATTYRVTDQRLVLTRGLFVRSVDEIELYRVKDVRLSYSLLNRIADIGTITLSSSDQTTLAAPLVLRDVPMARDRREGLRGLVERARIRRGVREVDIDRDANLDGLYGHAALD